MDNSHENVTSSKSFFWKVGKRNTLICVLNLLRVHRKTRETVTYQTLCLLFWHRKKLLCLQTICRCVPDHKVHIFFDDSMWLKGIVFGRFVNIKKKLSNGASSALNNLINKNGQGKSFDCV